VRLHVPLPARRGRATLWLAAAALASAATPLAAATAQPHHSMPAAATVHRVLFDDSKAEQAGNADWVISTSMPDPLGQDSSPQSETDWTGAISSWGVALQKTGQYSLKTLAPGNTITYGGGGALDLSNFDVFVLPEPNVQLSAAEKTAIMKFVQAGGGLFLISDHNGSDRNNDGWDSPKVINDLLTNNGVDNTDPFGFSVDVKNINTDNPVVTHGSNPIVNGSFGTVTGSILRSGTTMTLHPADNPNVSPAVWLSTADQSGTTDAFVVTSTFGSGHVAVWGDSSTIDDGTGASGENLFDGWNDPAGTDAAIGLNATAWLATGTSGTGGGGGGTQLLGNAGFESGTASPWTGTARINQTTTEPAHAGTWDAWLDGTGATHTDTLSQQVTIPSTATAASLSFWLHVDSAEPKTTAYDTLKAQVLNGSGTVLSTLATYSNVDQATGYVQHSFNLSAYAGQTVTVKFTGAEDYTKQTSFVIDDTALTTG
jgi:hypothetical protein